MLFFLWYNIIGEIMIIKEYFTRGKVDDLKNEDGIFIGHGIIAVIDGVTSKTSNLYKG